MPERERIVKTGDFARVHWYPVRREASGKRGKRNRESSLVQQKLNQKNRERMLADILHLNFTAQDYFLRLSYETQPDSIAEADKQLKNFFRRVRYYRKKNGLSELKYIYFTERGTQSGRIHHHVFISGSRRAGRALGAWIREHAAAAIQRDRACRVIEIRYKSKKAENRAGAGSGHGGTDVELLEKPAASAVEPGDIQERLPDPRAGCGVCRCAPGRFRVHREAIPGVHCRRCGADAERRVRWRDGNADPAGAFYHDLPLPPRGGMEQEGKE